VKKVKLGAALLLIAALVLFLLQNLSMVNVKFLAWSAGLPLAIPILVGFFVGGVAARPLLRFLNSQRKERAQDKRSAQAAEKVVKESKAATAEAD